MGCVMDEYASISETVFPEILRPALSDHKGWCCMIGTPAGHNAFFDLYEKASVDDDWLCVVNKASETGILDQEELAAAKTMMSENQYAQEFECSWNANVPGAIYGKELEAAQTEGRICNVPYDPAAKLTRFLTSALATVHQSGSPKLLAAQSTSSISTKRATKACRIIARC